MDKLSKNFTREEFACKGENCCGHSAPVESRLILGLQALRNNVGYPIRINRGFSCVKHNATIPGAAPLSQHTFGNAADIWCKELTPEELAKEAEKIHCFKNGGIGIYSNRIHVDVRNGIARWKG